MLKRVSIQNFKSLKDVTLDLQPVNLLIGPNNSGKTNFLKALEFCGKLYSSEEQSFSHKIDYTKLSFKKQDVSVQISLIDSDDKTINIILHLLEKLTKETIIEHKNKIRKLFGTSQLYIYKTDPNKLDRPAPVGRGQEIVNADASNLIAFFDRIRDEFPDSFTNIKSDLAKCIPEFTEINFQNIGATEELIKEFGDKTFKRIGLTNGKQKTIYWADELSEGTLYFLALLCIVNQPNPPKLLLLEEPERGIHPRRIREVMDFIFRLAEEKDIQIILTTHNEHVLDDFSTRPEAVFVFDKDEEGATYVRNLQTDIIEPTNQRNRELGLDDIDLTTNLSENWLYGLLGGVPPIV